jgi:hypothetical protein
LLVADWSEAMNLVFSYSSTEDERLAAAGFRFLGSAYDKDHTETHVFELVDVASTADDSALDAVTEKAQALVNHNLSFRRAKKYVVGVHRNNGSPCSYHVDGFSAACEQAEKYSQSRNVVNVSIWHNNMPIRDYANGVVVKEYNGILETE